MARSPFKRTDRVASLIHEILSEILRTQVKDPRVQSVTITDVEVTGDLREARVFITHHQGTFEEDDVLEGLERAKGFVRRELGQRLRMRVTPSLDFRMDHSFEYGARIEQKLRELGLGESSSDASDEPVESVDEED